ncbi:MAG: hypothetical protein R3F17_07775 [Planctomycetota bacterium]
MGVLRLLLLLLFALPLRAQEDSLSGLITQCRAASMSETRAWVEAWLAGPGGSVQRLMEGLERGSPRSRRACRGSWHVAVCKGSERSSRRYSRANSPCGT